MKTKPKPRKKRIVLIIGIVLALALVVVGYLFLTRNPAVPIVQDSTPHSKKPVDTPDSTLRLIATGDMLPHDTVNQAAKTADGYDYVPLFEPVKPYLTGTDVSFCNQEAPSAPGLSVTGYPAFNAPAAFARDLQKVGCSMINLANNHSNDKRQTGINQTRDVWDGLETLAVAGTARSASEQTQISYFEKSGVRFAFLSYTQCSNDNNLTSYGVNLLTRSLTDAQLAEARQQADILVVGVHWCRENTHTPDSTQKEWAAYFASQGVDVVIGTGPHWLQPVERLTKAGGGETIVWHSLGNFLNSQVELEGLISGIAVMDIDIASKAVTKIGFMPTYMHYEWTAAEAAASDYLARTNLKLYPLDQAAQPLSRSLHDTTVQVQTNNVGALLNSLTPVTMLTSGKFFDAL